MTARRAGSGRKRSGRLAEGGSQDRLFGQAARALGFITAEQLLECLDLQATIRRRLGRHVPIGEVLILRGLLAISQLRLVLHEIGATAAGAAGRGEDDDLFGRIAIERGFCTSEHVLRCLDLQAAEERAGTRRRPIGEIMIAEGYLSARQVGEVLRAQKNARSA